MQKKKKILILGLLVLIFITTFGFSRLQPKKSEAKMSSIANINNLIGKKFDSQEIVGGWEITDTNVSGKYKNSSATGLGDHWILWGTVDKKATSKITWGTESYIGTEKTVSDKGYDCYKGGKTFPLKREELCQKKLPDGRVWTLYGVPYKSVEAKVNSVRHEKGSEAFLENAKDGSFTVYLQPVIKVMHKGVVVKKGITNLATWKKAESWGDPSTFKDHYDKKVVFHPEGIKVKVHYVKRDGKEMETKQKIIASNVLEKVPIGKTISLGNKLKNEDGEKIDVLNDHFEIKDKDGKKYVISKTFAKFSVSNEERDFIGSEPGSVEKAIEDSKEKVFAKKATGINEGMLPKNGRKLTMKEWFGLTGLARVRGSIDDIDIFLCYDEINEEGKDSGITVKYKKIVYPKGEKKYETAKNDWKVKKEEVPKEGKNWEHKFSQTLKSEGDPYFGFKRYEVKYKDKKTGSQKTLKESGTQVGNNYVYYDNSQWKGLVGDKGKNYTKFKMPNGPVTINVFYQAKLPAILLIYDTSDKDKIKLVKETPMKERLDVGKTNKKTVPTTMPGDNKKKITSIAVSSGDIKGAFGATSNGYKENKLPSNLKTIKKDCSDLTGESYQVSFEMQSKPTYLVVTYGGNPLEPDPEKDPDPDKNSSNKPKTIDLNGIKVTTVGTPSDVVTPFEVTLPPTPTNASDSKDAMDGVRNIDAIGKIEADKTKNPQFDTTQAIPSSEFVMGTMFTPLHLLEYKGERHDITITYDVTVTRKYVWTTTSTSTDKDGKPVTTTKEHSQTGSNTVAVKRSIKVIKMKVFNAFAAKNATLWNYCFGDGENEKDWKLYLESDDSNNPGLEMEVDYEESAAVKDGGSISLKMDGGTVSGKPSVPESEDFALANSQIPELQGRNDKLDFKDSSGITTKCLKNDWTGKPDDFLAPKAVGEQCNEKMLHKDQEQIKFDKKNGYFNSTGTVYYDLVTSIKDGESKSFLYGADVNAVTIHTPVINLSHVVKDNKYVQTIKPKEVKGVVLDTKFKINVPAKGNHITAPGYGNRDYDKYVDTHEVLFPFDTMTEDGKTYYPKGTWIVVPSGETTFLCPSWSQEGVHEVQFRNFAINARPNNKDNQQQYAANTNLENYVAIASERIEVSGRIYGLKIFDFSDYPTWQSVFRQSNSYMRTGFSYTNGIANQNGILNGRNSYYAFPVVNGDHPNLKTAGILKPGYTVRFELETVGEMFDGDDSIQIIPSFYYVSKNGRTRFPVDVYYEETYGGEKHRLVKMGSEEDKKNRKSLSIGDKKLAVSYPFLKETAKILGYQTTSKFSGLNRPVWNYTKIQLPSTMRTYVGTWHETLLDNTPVGKNVGLPDGVPYETKAKSVQNWYCTYYFPTGVHAVKKDTNMDSVIKQGVTYKEKEWLKDGYLSIQFDVKTLDGGKEKLNYGKTENCNMWKMEKSPEQKIDYRGNRIPVEDGDFLLYDLDSDATDDYLGSGTH